MTNDESSEFVLTRIIAAQHMIFTELLKMLVEKGVLHQGEVIARYTELSNKMMSDPSGVHVVQFADMIRETIAGEPGPKPS